MNLKIRSGTVRFNNKILLSDSRFRLGKNSKVNTSESKKSSHRVPIVPQNAHKTSIVHACKEVSSKHTSAITHEEEKISLVLVLTGALGIWQSFDNEEY